MNPGKLNKRIEIQGFEKTFDSEGIEEKNWKTIRPVF